MPSKITTERDHAIMDLKALIKPGDKVYTILRHRAASGMFRVIDLFVIKNDEPVSITWAACKATGSTYNRRHEGMAAPGCGLDVGFEAVYNIGRALWENGDGKYKTGRNGMSGPETDGGYLLRQVWL